MQSFFWTQGQSRLILGEKLLYGWKQTLLKQTLLKLNLQDEGGSYVNGFVYILTIYRKCLPI